MLKTVIIITALVFTYLMIGAILYTSTKNSDDDRVSVGVAFMLFWPFMLIICVGWLVTVWCLYLSEKIVGLFKHKKADY